MAGTDGGNTPKRGGVPFDVTTESDADHVTVVLRGEIDIAAVAAVREAVDRSLGSHGRVVIDLGEVTFIDSSGLRAVVESRRANPDKVAIGACSDAVAMVIELTGLSDVLGR